MAEDNTQKIEEENKTEKNNPTDTSNKSEEKSREEITAEELESINKEIEEANKSLVSEDVAKVIKLEKEAAKKEAEKEFLVNQRVKDLEAEKIALAKEMEHSEKEAAAKLEKLTERVNSLISSKATVKNDNPFNEPQPAKVPTNDDMTEEQEIDIETGSAIAFLGEEIYGKK